MNEKEQRYERDNISLLILLMKSIWSTWMTGS